MLSTKIKIWMSAIAVVFALEVGAKVSPEEADKLGKELTPMGSIRAGNAAGTIPEWTGGYNGPLGLNQYGEAEDPYSDDKILFTITAENMDQYKENLSPGQMAMLKKYPTWKMHVYQSRRTVGYTDRIYDAIKKNALTAELTLEGNGVKNCGIANPFPIKNNGHEYIWNYRLGYQTNSFYISDECIPTSSGDFEISSWGGWFECPYSQNGPSLESVDYIFQRGLAYGISPPLDAGIQVLLVEEIPPDRFNVRNVWAYDTNTRRVRRSPLYQYDASVGDGQGWSDAGFGFSGPLDKFDFKVIGEREMYLPYNCYKIIDRSLSYKDIIQPGHVNPEFVRWELHRVTEVEAVLKPGERHICPRRRLFLEEDCNLSLIADYYDSKGNLFRHFNFYEPFDYVNKSYVAREQAIYNLENGRYILTDFRNELKDPIITDITYRKGFFTTEHMMQRAR